MKITLVTEHKIIIGELMQAQAQAQAQATEGGCACQSCNVPLIRVETHPALAHARSPLQATDTPLGTPLGTPPTTLDGYKEIPATMLPAAMAALAPCAVGDFVAFTIKITNIVERNA